MKSKAIRRPSRRLDTAPQRILSAGLATATAVGLIGVIGVRTAQDSAAADNANLTAATLDASSTATVSTAGYTKADLDAYAAQLDAERQRLEDYRAKLVNVANALQQGGAVRSATTKATAAPAKVPTAKKQSAPAAQSAPKAKPAPAAAAPKPQAKSKSS